jgi:glycosyltransferase involved in cell wall biosynthesis
MKPLSTRDDHAYMGALRRSASCKRILVIADSFVPTTTSTAKLVKDLVDEFGRRQIAVTVLVPSLSVERPCEVSTENGIEVVRIRIGKTKGAGKVIRGLRELSFSQRIWWRARHTLLSRSFDLIIFFSPTIFFGPLVRRLKALFGCPAYLVVRDVWTQFMLDVGELKLGLAYKYLERIERFQYSAADVIGVQSPRDLSYVNASDASARRKVEVLLNWYAAPTNSSRQTSYRQKLGLSNCVLFFFGGNFGVAQDPLNILRLAASLKREPHIRFLLVGWGSHVRELHKVIAEQELTNVILRDAIPQDEFALLLTEIDVGIVSLDRRFKINNVPGRFMAYLSAGRPVLASVNPGNDLFSILGDGKAGYCCENGHDEALREHALALASNTVLREELGRHARYLLESIFSPKRAADQVLNHFDDCGVVKSTRNSMVASSGGRRET